MPLQVAELVGTTDRPAEAGTLLVDPEFPEHSTGQVFDIDRSSLSARRARVPQFHVGRYGLGRLSGLHSSDRRHGAHWMLAVVAGILRGRIRRSALYQEVDRFYRSPSFTDAAWAPGKRRALHRGVSPDDGIAPNDGVPPDDRESLQRGITPHNGVAPNNGIAPNDRVAPDDGVAPDDRLLKTMESPQMMALTEHSYRPK